MSNLIMSTSSSV